MSLAPGKVFLVGAGPGDPALVTLRGVECLRQAHLILYDELTSPRLLDYASPGAEKVPLRELAELHGERSALALSRAIDAARKGQSVVRLKGGDPTIFGRCFEETALLRQAGVPYEIVPGVTAACAASAYAEIPLTHREHSSTVVFLTGHECPGKTESAVAWPHLAQLQGTLAIYMGVKRLEEVCRHLRTHGMSPQTPAAVVQWASAPRQRTVFGTLATIGRMATEAGLQAPAMVLLGPAVGLGQQPSWFEALPLRGQTVLVTRPVGQADDMVRELERLGAEVFACPMLVIGPPPDLEAVTNVLADLPRYQLLAFTSGNGVRAFMSLLRQNGQDLRALGHVKLAAIGPNTAAALAAFHLQADLLPEVYRSEDLAAQLIPRVRGQRVLLARADRGRDVLPRQLAAVAEVTQIAVYSQVACTELPGPVRQLLASGRHLHVTLTSGNIARQFLALLPKDCTSRVGTGIHLISISPVTTQAVREQGYQVAGEAKVYTPAGVVAALVEMEQHRKARPTSAVP